MPAADESSQALLATFSEPTASRTLGRSRGPRNASRERQRPTAAIARFERVPASSAKDTSHHPQKSVVRRQSGRDTRTGYCEMERRSRDCQNGAIAFCQAARGWRWACTIAWLLLGGLFPHTASAASVAFENCLADWYVNYKPVPLQWDPKHVDAFFDNDDAKHTLRVVMYGNVTGSTTNLTLPRWDSPDWADNSVTAGKIVDQPDPNAGRTTLHSKVEVLSYEPWNETVGFCNNTALNDLSCPISPVFNKTVEAGNYTHLPAVSLTNDFYSSYAFSSFSVTFIIINGGPEKTIIGCVSATVTPDLGDLAWMLKFLPLAVLLFVGFATVFAGVLSPWGTTDIFNWSSNYGRDADLLRLVTPGFGDCLQYIQFIVLTGGLTLNYPGFYQPIVSQASWSTLMFNESFVSHEQGTSSLEDGVYAPNGFYGLQRLAGLVGMGQPEDIWAGMMVWVLVIIAAMFVLVQTAFLVQWVYRSLTRNPEEDLRAKNIPFTIGNVVRIVLGYFLFPVVAFSTFQLVVASTSKAYTVALAALTLLLVLGFAAWLFRLIVMTKPRSFLFDDLSTVLLYGPLYNTYSDEAAAYALVPLFCTILRGIAVGAVQPVGVAQVVLLAIPEIIQILTLNAFRPFHSATSMNAYHILFSILRLITVMMMIAFIPSLGVTEGPKGWIGYAILVVHAGVLVLGFFLNALQTIIEVVARLLGAGGDDIRGQSRGGLSKIFGMRQLSRRMSRRETGPSRQSQLSSSAMLDADEISKTGYVMPGGRVRSESAGSMGVLLHQRHRSSSALDNLSLDAPVRHTDSGASSFIPNTPGEASVFSFLPSPGHQARVPPNNLSLQTAGPYYRPPRARRTPVDASPSQADAASGSWTPGEWSQKRLSQAGGTLGDPLDLEAEIHGGTTPAPAPAPYSQPAIPFAPRTDYSTREVDFYYGVRGERLNSDAPSRKLGTGPADPTGPMASAAGWFRNMFGAKTKEKGKGFEVVRSARMPPAMRARGGELEDEAPPEGIPVAMGVLRNGPIESDDEDEGRRRDPRTRHGTSHETELLSQDGTPREDDADEIDIPRVSDMPPTLPDVDSGGSIRLPSRIQSRASRYTSRSDFERQDVPELPRKSSKRMSDQSQSLLAHARALPSQVPGDQVRSYLAPSGTASSRLPFERTPSQKRLSGSSTGATEDFSQVDLHDTSRASDERPTSYGYVQQGSISRVDRDIDLLGSSAEVVDLRR